jgi:uncharacterized DUF497 family protein
MKYLNWDSEKNQILKRKRGISFEEIVLSIEPDQVIGIEETPGYPNQKIYVLEIDKRDIRCTSVRPYRLPVGENTAERLRDEIADAEVVLGILTPDTHESSYVLFELGSAWGQNVWTSPLLARGADQSHIPDPIRDLSPLSLQDAGECRQLLDDMAGFTSLTRIDTEGSEIYDKIQALIKASAEEFGGQS